MHGFVKTGRPAYYVIILLFLSVLPLSVTRAHPGEPPNDHEITLSQAIREQLNAIETIELPPKLDHAWEELDRFYVRRQYQPVWFGDTGLNTRAQFWLETIKAAASHGLEPEDYHWSFLQRHRDDQPVLMRVWVELLMTKALMQYIKDMLSGRLTPQDVIPDWHINKPPINIRKQLQHLLESHDFQQALDSLPPPHAGYRRLRSAFIKYQALQSTGGWPAIPDGPVLQQGDIDEQVAMLRRRLRAEGDLVINPLGGRYEFDEPVKEAVEHFQARYGINVDGVVGPETRAAMNVPIEQRIRQMQVNLERWRWLPRHFGKSYLLVNIAGYELAAYQHGKLLFITRIVAGTPERNTPAVAGPLQSIILNPYWYIPRTIAINDILPILRRRPNYLDAMGIRVFTNAETALTKVNAGSINWRHIDENNFHYQLRQDPGPHNSLGQIKFKFANNYALYLHDTPKKRLFEREFRAFSSGCIRVENAIDLAAYLLQHQDNWSKGKILNTIDSQETMVVKLQNPVPLYLVYWTSWVGNDRHVNFRYDIYGWDQAQSQRQ
jgi:murein L,D-transpeptidase YcbB/YkuD